MHNQNTQKGKANTRIPLSNLTLNLITYIDFGQLLHVSFSIPHTGDPFTFSLLHMTLVLHISKDNMFTILIYRMTILVLQHKG